MHLGGIVARRRSIGPGAPTGRCGRWRSEGFFPAAQARENTHKPETTSVCAGHQGWGGGEGI
jgi:hypothetical protein